MHPGNNPLWKAHCSVCGSEGWTRNAVDQYYGANFVCARGCDPERIKAKQAEKNQKLQTCEHASHI